jgi:hypothetical protein
MKATSGVAIAALALVRDLSHVRLHHVCDKRVEAGLVSPAEFGMRFARIAKQSIDFCRTEIARIHLDQDLARRLVDTFVYRSSHDLPSAS